MAMTGCNRHAISATAVLATLDHPHDDGALPIDGTPRAMPGAQDLEMRSAQSFAWLLRQCPLFTQELDTHFELIAGARRLAGEARGNGRGSGAGHDCADCHLDAGAGGGRGILAEGL